MTRHLDLGCGDKPRNPYRCSELHGVDVFPRHEPGDYEIREANLVVAPIPYPDDHFDCVSAYDFLEHVPRVLATADGRSTRFPFVELMNEIWRVLKPGGRFYASTPHFPNHQAFGDPTHVNFLTFDSHAYFTRPMLLGRMYGFTGDFTAERVVPVIPREAYEPVRRDLLARMKRRLLRYEWVRARAGTHLLWEFEANK